MDAITLKRVPLLDRVQNTYSQFQLATSVAVAETASAGRLVTASLSHARAGIAFAFRTRTSLAITKFAVDLDNEATLAMEAVRREEATAWVNLLIYWLHVQEWYERRVCFGEWHYFAQYCESSEPQWRSVAAHAAEVRVMQEIEARSVRFAEERIELEDTVRRRKTQWYEEMVDWLAAIRLMEEDDRAELVRIRERDANERLSAAAAVSAMSNRPGTGGGAPWSRPSSATPGNPPTQYAARGSTSTNQSSTRGGYPSSQMTPPQPQPSLSYLPYGVPPQQAQPDTGYGNRPVYPPQGAGAAYHNMPPPQQQHQQQPGAGYGYPPYQHQQQQQQQAPYSPFGFGAPPPSQQQYPQQPFVGRR